MNGEEENEGHLVGMYLWLSPELKDATQADVPNASRSRKRWCEYCACDQNMFIHHVLKNYMYILISLA